jgi:hypothetical protein
MGEPEDKAAQKGPLEQEIHALLYEEARKWAERPPEEDTGPLGYLGDVLSGVLAAQSRALIRLAHEIDDLKAERGL